MSLRWPHLAGETHLYKRWKPFSNTAVYPDQHVALLTPWCKELTNQQIQRTAKNGTLLMGGKFSGHISLSGT
jgi:hypothetical protein